jgi:hypothetical protein
MSAILIEKLADSITGYIKNIPQILKHGNPKAKFPRLALLLWIILASVALFSNEGSSVDFILYIGPQIILFALTFWRLSISGILLLIDSVAITTIFHVVVFEYGIDALLSVVIVLSAPPLVCGCLFVWLGLRHKI